MGEGNEGQQAERQQGDQRPHDGGQPQKRVAGLSWRNHVVLPDQRGRVGSITRDLLGPSHRFPTLVAPTNGKGPLLAASSIACQQDSRILKAQLGAVVHSMLTIIVLSAVPLPCHSQQSWPVSSEQSRTTPQRAPPAPSPDGAGDQPGRPGFASRWSMVKACIGLAVPGRPIGPWSRRTGAPEASATGRDRNPRCSRDCSRDAPQRPGMRGYRAGRSDGIRPARWPGRAQERTRHHTACAI